MISYKKLKKQYLGVSCRSCLNEKLHLNLTMKNCHYIYYPYQCGICGKQKNIVMDITPQSRWKLLFGRE